MNKFYFSDVLNAHLYFDGSIIWDYISKNIILKHGQDRFCSSWKVVPIETVPKDFVFAVGEGKALKKVIYDKTLADLVQDVTKN